MTPAELDKLIEAARAAYKALSPNDPTRAVEQWDQWIRLARILATEIVNAPQVDAVEFQRLRANVPGLEQQLSDLRAYCKELEESSRLDVTRDLRTQLIELATQLENKQAAEAHRDRWLATYNAVIGAARAFYPNDDRARECARREADHLHGPLRVELKGV